MSSIIQVLPDHVANQIAAGEVVQRPASVVKELLENAVDAKATDIKLIVKDAGKTLVQVIDNGLGMSVTDARLCFERHATSKIKKAEDLFDLHTKGFRGEALASIAAIAHVELKTKQEQQELGTHIIIEGSKLVTQDVAVVPKGTSFSVKNLFFNIPARRNFLKSDTVELRHIIDEFQRVALAHPNIYFSMYHNGNEVFNLPDSNERQRIVNLFSGKTNEKLVPVGEETEIIQIQGFVSKPEFARKNRNEQFFFVNDRYIKSGYLHHAIISAYDGLLKEGMQPSYFLYLQVPPNTVDINIHPTKTEVKFDDEQALYAILRAAVKHSLGQFNVAPILDFDRDAALDIPYQYAHKEAEIPAIRIDTNFNPFEDTSTKSFSNTRTYPSIKGPTWESLYVNLKQDTETVVDFSNFEMESETTSGMLFDEKEVQQSVSKTYQINKKYIVNPIKSGMIIIDQQKAHQRVLYEQFLTNMTVHQAMSQQLLFPIRIEFSFSEMKLLSELRESLENTGFAFSSFEDSALEVSGLPLNTNANEVAKVLEQLVFDLQEGIPTASFSQNDSIAKSMARSLAIKTGDYLTETEQESLINSLFACKEPNVSPFSKNTFITLNVSDIDKKFQL